MLDKLRQIAIFAKTVECGSFVKAASVLQLSPSVVSHHIAQLEKQLGVALIYRSTRKLSLTSDGEKLLKSAQKMTGSAEEFINLAVGNNSELIGHLNITLPAFMAKSELVKLIGDFIKLNPNISIKIDFSDNQRKIIEDGIDLAIRMGKLHDSTLKARKLFEMKRCVAASVQLADQITTTKSPKNLEKEQWIEFSAVGLRYDFENKNGEKVTINPHSSIAVNNLYATIELVKNSNGISVLPKFLVDNENTNDEIAILLSRWQLPPISAYAVWPANTPKDGITKKFIEFIVSKNAYL